MSHRVKEGENHKGGQLRVLFVDFATHFGGAVLSLADVLKGLRGDEDLVPHVLAYQDPATVDELFRGVGRSAKRRYLTHLSRARFKGWAGRWLKWEPLVRGAMRLYTLVDYGQELLLSWGIYRELRRNRIDVLHLNNGPNRIGLRAARWADVPVVGHLRGHGGSEVTPLQRRLSADPRVIAAIAISRSVAESVIGHGMPRQKVVVIHNPVDMEAFDEAVGRRDAIRSQWGLPPRSMVAGAFGRVMRYKGQEEFMMAAAPLIEEYPELRLMIVGDSSDAPDQDYLAHLQELATRDPFKGRVTFTGYQQDVAGYFCACDLVVHSSRIREGFGRVVAEGMAASRPVIAMDEAGPKDIVTHGVDGLLVPPRDVEALSAAMSSLMASPALRESLGANGRRTVEERFSIPVIAGQLMAFYRDLAIHQRRSAPRWSATPPPREGAPRS